MCWQSLNSFWKILLNDHSKIFLITQMHPFRSLQLHHRLTTASLSHRPCAANILLNRCLEIRVVLFNLPSLLCDCKNQWPSFIGRYHTGLVLQISCWIFCWLVLRDPLQSLEIRVILLNLPSLLCDCKNQWPSSSGSAPKQLGRAGSFEGKVLPLLLYWLS